MSPPSTRDGLVRRLRALLAHAALWSAGAQALASGMSLLVSVVVARTLGAGPLGEYTLVMAGVSIAASVQYQVVSGPMMTVAGLGRRSPAYFASVAAGLTLAALLSGAVVALYVAVLERVGPGFSTGGLASAAFLMAAGLVLHDGLKRVLFVRDTPVRAFAFEAARYAVFALSVALLWAAAGPGVLTLALCFGAAALVVAMPLLVRLLRAGGRGRLHGAVFNRHWRLGRWMLLMVLVSMVHEQFVTIAAGAMLGTEAAAGLRAAHVLFGPLLVLFSSLENFVPKQAATHLRAGGRPALAAYLRRVAIVGGLPVLVLCGLAAVFAAPLLHLLLGKEFAAFAPVVAIIALSPPIVFVREICVTGLRTTGETRGVFDAFAVSAVVTALALVPLIHGLGINGAAVAIVLGHGASAVLILWWAARGARRHAPA